VNWAGISIALGLVVVAAVSGPIGWIVCLGLAVVLWRMR